MTEAAVRSAAATLVEEKGRKLWSRYVAEGLGKFPMPREQRGLTMIGVHQVKVTRLILKVVCLVSSP